MYIYSSLVSRNWTKARACCFHIMATLRYPLPRGTLQVVV